jgi:uncharacterized repeat protein (TIGR02543 family)
MTGVYYPSTPASSSWLVLPWAWTMERIGYTFSGWNTMIDGSGIGYAVGSTFIVQSWNSTLYAQWTPITYQTAYDANGWIGLMNDQWFVYDILQNLTGNIFIRTGYTFSGRNSMLDGSGTGYSDWENVNNLTTISWTIVTLYAQWNINSYTISYTGWWADGGSAPVNQTGDYNSTVTLAANTYTRAWYSFSGWDCGSEWWSYTLTGDVVCIAEWTINSYTVTFQDYNATFISSWSVTYGSWATAPANPSRIGYTFSGWNNDFSNVTWDLTVMAEYTINAYTVTFEDRDNSFISSWLVTYGSWATAPSNPSRTGYTFSGWNNNFSNVTGDITITAEYMINSYTISYTGWWADGGSAPVNQTGDYNSTVTLAANTYTRAWYSFSGWDCGSEWWSYTLTGDVVCIAEWTINSYTVTFQDYNATFISSWSVMYGSWATAPANPSRIGYTFSGWNNDFSNVTGDITITAEYMINSYSITFNTDGGAPIMAITGDYNSVIIVPSNPTKTGYNFSGWLPLLPTNMPALNTTVMAQWTLIPVVTPPSVPAPWWYAGGWAWWYFAKDNCPNGDYSVSYYDSQCGTTPTTWEENILDDTISSSICTQADYNLSSFQALKKTTEKRQFIVCRLYANGQTIFDDVPEFDYNRVVTREEASRMITKFVEEILKKDKIRNSNDPLCQFTDLKLANPWLKTYITDSCQYGIFNGTYDHNFLPTQQLNQAHAIATVLRASYGYQDESWSVRFTPYIDMISTKSLTRKTFTKPNDLKVLERRGMTRGNLWELMYRVAIDLL